MASEKLVRENLVHIDGKGRVVLPKGVRRAELYAVEVTDKDEIILRPRVAVDPRAVISTKTLAVLDEAMQNLGEGKVRAPIDLSRFSTGEEANGKKATASRRKKSSRR